MFPLLPPVKAVSGRATILISAGCATCCGSVRADQDLFSAQPNSPASGIKRIRFSNESNSLANLPGQFGKNIRIILRLDVVNKGWFLPVPIAVATDKTID